MPMRNSLSLTTLVSLWPHPPYQDPTQVPGVPFPLLWRSYVGMQAYLTLTSGVSGWSDPITAMRPEENCHSRGGIAACDASAGVLARSGERIPYRSR